MNKAKKRKPTFNSVFALLKKAEREAYQLSQAYYDKEPHFESTGQADAWHLYHTLKQLLLKWEHRKGERPLKLRAREYPKGASTTLMTREEPKVYSYGFSKTAFRTRFDPENRCHCRQMLIGLYRKELSVRAVNCLLNANIRQIKGIWGFNAAQLANTRNLGKVSLRSIEQFLEKHMRDVHGYDANEIEGN